MDTLLPADVHDLLGHRWVGDGEDSLSSKGPDDVHDQLAGIGPAGLASLRVLGVEHGAVGMVVDQIEEIVSVEVTVPLGNPAQHTHTHNHSFSI